MARRKIVFVIVEGASDETALGVALTQIFDKDSVHVHIMHGDITTRAGVSSQNIVAKIGNEVRAYAVSNHYKAKDFKQIIHIVDTDAAYLLSEKIRLFRGNGGLKTSTTPVFIPIRRHSTFG